jgi:hypothetical protein
MPDLVHSTKHSWHSRRLHTFAQTIAHSRIGGGGGILCNFAHLFRSIFSSPGLRDAKIKSDEARRGISLPELPAREYHCDSRLMLQGEA